MPKLIPGKNNYCNVKFSSHTVNQPQAATPVSEAAWSPVPAWSPPSQNHGKGKKEQ